MPVIYFVTALLGFVLAGIVAIFIQLNNIIALLKAEIPAAERDTMMIENVNHALGQLTPPKIRKVMQ